MSEPTRQSVFTDEMLARLSKYHETMRRTIQEHIIMEKLGRLAVLGGVPVADVQFIRKADRMDRVSKKIETFDLYGRSELNGYEGRTKQTFADKISPQTAWLLSDNLALTTRKMVIRSYLLEEDYEIPNTVGYLDRDTAMDFRRRGIGAIALESVWLAHSTDALRDEVEAVLDENIYIREEELRLGPDYYLPAVPHPLPRVSYLGDQE